MSIFNIFRGKEAKRHLNVLNVTPTTTNTKYSKSSPINFDRLRWAYEYFSFFIFCSHDSLRIYQRDPWVLPLIRTTYYHVSCNSTFRWSCHLPYSMTGLGRPEEQVFKTHSQVCRAEGLNPWPLVYETNSLPRGHRSLLGYFPLTLEVITSLMACSLCLYFVAMKFYRSKINW